MQARHLILARGAAGLALALMAPGPALLAGAPKAAAPASAPAAATAKAEIPQSGFNVAENPKEGRDPFFPQSQWNRPVPKPTKADTLDFGGFVLNGITSPPRQTAMINNRTFEPGEEAEVKLPTGAKVLVKCIEIKTDSAVIECLGQRRTLRLRSGI